MAVDHVAVNLDRMRRSATFTVAQLVRAQAAIDEYLRAELPILPEERMWTPCMYISRRAMTAIRWLIFLTGALIILAGASTIAGSLLWRAIGRAL